MRDIDPDKLFRDMFVSGGEEQEDGSDPWITSDHCTHCGGQGFTVSGGYYEEAHQCEECERLHELEVRADRMMDEAKGN